ncbi:MAG: radical SAM family heme chaperone HemW [Saprospiraceae bacterium]|nr:radical SAM family heme chaperone HemW [Saprospiraceae bacterium]
MSGIYFHIPFCKQACHYCNFHFSTSLRQKTPLLNAMLRELELRRDYPGDAVVQTLYLGGGTPSLLEIDELHRLFEHIYRLFPVAPDAEVTLEANPDDLTAAKIAALRQTPVNRLSIGIQSFSDADLQFMNRAHNSGEAQRCIEMALNAGFTDLSLDLIYGTPGMSDAQWVANIETVLAFDVPHLSCYCLTVEPQTALDHFVKKGKARPVDDAQAARQLEYLMHRLNTAGYEHYEISNFAKPGRYSRHNTSYWTGEAYLGIGPSAHSFNGVSRQWNVANNARYIQALEPELPDWKALFELETLTPEQRYNEYVMTSLRTQWGCDLARIRNMGKRFEAFFMREVVPFLEDGSVHRRGEVFLLTQKGKLIGDYVASELFWVE